MELHGVTIMPLVIFYVNDLPRSRRLYTRLLGDAVLDVDGMVQFRLGEGALLGLMPSLGIQRLLPNLRAPGEGARAELYLFVDNPDEVFAAIEDLQPLSPCQPRSWGDEAAYALDPDGHVIGLARIPRPAPANKSGVLSLLPKEHGFDEPLGLLSDCHRRIEKFLAVLKKVAADAPEPLDETHRRALETALDYFENAAPRHTEDEEHSLFPRLAQHAEAEAAMAGLAADHQRADALHAEVGSLGRSWLAEGRISLDQRERMRAGTESLEHLYREHIRREDEEVFPLAARLLAAETLGKIGQEMAARRGLSCKSIPGP